MNKEQRSPHGDNQESGHLPIYGVGPYYGVGIMFMCSGAIFIAHNAWLLFLPIVFWAAMTILMKETEEKWLAKLYGQEYRDYCKKVNRCLPWFPKKL